MNEPNYDMTPTRIDVAVSPGTVEALQTIMAREGVPLSEAVRRLVTYGDVAYRAVKENGEQILLRTGDTTREVVLL